MSRLVQEKTRHYEIVEIGKEADAAVELHTRLAAECTGASKAIREYAEKNLARVFEKVAQDLAASSIEVEHATKVREYLSLALHEANKFGRGLEAQRLREEGAAAVLKGLVGKLEKRRDATVAKVDALEAQERVQEGDENASAAGTYRGGIMAQRRAERLAEEAKAKAEAEKNAK